MTDTLSFTPPTTAPDNAHEGESESKRSVDRRLILLGVALLVVVLGGAAMFLLRGGSSSTDAGTFPMPAHPAAGHDSSASASPSALAPIAKYTGAPAGRDPFAPLVKPAAATGVPGASAAPSGAASAPAPAPTAAAPSGSTPGGASAPTSPSAAVSLTLHAIVGADTSSPEVQVVYNGKSQEMKVGDVLGGGEVSGGTVKLQSIQPDDNVATFEIGDGTYDIHVGQTFTG